MLFSELNLTGKRLPTVRLLLAIKSRLVNAGWFYLIFIIFKFLGLIILTSNFIPVGEENIGYKVTSILRSITLLGIFGRSLDMTSYSISCVFIFLVLLIFFLSYKIILKNSRADGEYIFTSDAKKIIIFISILFQILLIFSQHVIEYLSYIFLIQFNTGVDLSKSISNNNYLNKDYLLFQNTTTTFEGIIILLLNTAGILFMNIFLYFSLKIINEPFYDTDFPVRFKPSKISVFVYMIISNLQALNYIEIFIQDLTILKTFKFILLGFIMATLFIAFLETYYTFNFYNGFNNLINFLLNYAFFSCLIDVTLHLTDEKLNTVLTTLFVLIMKIIISLSFTYLSLGYNEKLLMNRMNQALFQNYLGNISKYDLNCLFYLMDLIIGLKDKSVDEYNKFYEIIIYHKNQCIDDNCKCQNIFDFKQDKLLHEVNIIIESIFVNLNLGKDPVVNMMFSEYLYFQRESTLFSWSMLNTYISKNYSTDSEYGLFSMYVLVVKKVHQYEVVMKQTENYVRFIDIFSQVSTKKFFEKKILKIMKNFEEYVSFKEKFDNSVKINHFDSTIEASVFKSSMTEIVNMCSRHQSLYKDIKRLIKKEFSLTPCKSVELAYKLFAFFTIFNKKTPRKISSLLCLDSSVQVNSIESVEKYFNKTFYKYFGDKKAPLNMIIEINKIFKIKYINHKLCQALGFSYNSLINDDIHQLFPAQLRESHKKVLINHFLIQKKVFFRKKTFAFTHSKNMFPLDLMVSTFPGLKKNLQAIVSIRPIEETETRSFFFVITEFFELIAISENFDKIYNINFDVIDKLGINVLKLFDIDGLISTKFKTQLDQIQKERHEKQFDYLYSLSNFLFNQSNGNDFQGSIGIEPVARNQQKKVASRKDLSLSIKPDASQSLNKDDSTNLDFLSNSLLPGELNKNNLNGGVSGSVDENNFKTQPNVNSPYKLGNERRGTKEFDAKNFQKVNLLSKKRGSQILSGGLLNHINKTPQNSQNMPNQDTTDTENQNLLSDKKDKNNSDYFSVVKDKGRIINNLEQLKNRVKDTETGHKFVEKLNEAINRLKKSYESSQGGNKKSISIFDNHNTGSLAGIRGSSGMTGPNFSFKSRQSSNSPTLTPQQTSEDKGGVTYSENFQIKVLFRKINDAPFFIINVKEKTIFKAPKKAEKKVPAKRSLQKQLTIVGENVEHGLSSNDDKISNFSSGEAFKKKKEGPNPWAMKLKKKFAQKSTGTHRRRSTKIGIPGKLKEVEIKVQLEKTKLEKAILRDPKGILKSGKRKIESIKRGSVSSLKKVEEEEQKVLEEELVAEKRKSLILNLLLTALLLVNLLTAIIVYIFKENIINTMQDFFNVQFWSLAQESSLLTLHSSLISFVLIINNLSTFNNNFLSNSGYKISYSDFKPIIEERSNFHRNNFAKLFSLAKSSNFKMTELENLLYSNEGTYQTLILTWDSTPIQQTFINMVDYICSNTRSISFENSYDELISDIDNAFLYEQFKNLKNSKIKSKHSKLIYYFNQNFLIIDEKIRQFSIAIENAKTEFNQKTKSTSSALEITNIILSFFSICLIHFTLNRSDRGLFKILLTMFLNLGKGKNTSFKATFECQIMRKRLQMYGELLKVFYVDTVRNFDETLYLREEEAIKLIKEINEKNKKKNDDEPTTFLNGLYNGILSGDTSKIKIGVAKDEPEELDRSANGNSSISLLRGPTSLDGSGIPGTFKFGHRSTDDTKKNENARNSLGKNQSGDKSQPNENINVITNEQILTMTKNYTINFIKFAKILISVIFCTYIFFIVANLVANTFYLQEIENNIQLVSSFVMKYPAAFRIFNMIRLMIFSNDVSFVEKYNDYYKIYDSASKFSQVLYDSYSTNLPQTFSYYDTLISQNYDLRSKQICVTETTKEICEVFLWKENGFNKEGINVAANTVMQNLNNVYKDYLKDYESGQNTFRGLESSRQTVKKYFYTEEFLNINLEMEYVFEQTTRGFFTAIDQDMSQLFSTVLNLEMLLGMVSILLNIIIILYLIFGFFSRLRMSMDYISYSAKKFNRALYEL
jgi:hypothetical protein